MLPSNLARFAFATFLAGTLIALNGCRPTHHEHDPNQPHSHGVTLDDLDKFLADIDDKDNVFGHVHDRENNWGIVVPEGEDRMHFLLVCSGDAEIPGHRKRCIMKRSRGKIAGTAVDFMQFVSVSSGQAPKDPTHFSNPMWSADVPRGELSGRIHFAASNSAWAIVAYDKGNNTGKYYLALNPAPAHQEGDTVAFEIQPSQLDSEDQTYTIERAIIKQE